MEAALWPQLWGAAFPIQLEFSPCLLPVSPSGTCGSGSLKAFVTPGTGGGGLQGALPCAGCGKAEAGWFLQDLSEEQPPGRAP